MHSLVFSYGYVLLPCLYFPFYLYTGNTLLVNRSMPPQATAKDTSPAPPPKGPFAPFWEASGSFAAMVLVLSCSLGWRLPLPRWRQPSWVCPHTALAAVHSLPYAHWEWREGAGEGCGATTTSRAACQSLKVPALAEGNPHLVSAWAVVLRHTCGPFSFSLREMQALGFLTHRAEQPFSHISSSSRLMFRRKCLHKAKYKAALRTGGVSSALPVSSGYENSTSFYCVSSSETGCVSWLGGRTPRWKELLAA